ncbi:hypothetical protein [Priestia aryabhattai]|uniref:hypothetical protein n=1 Tax=Priestia aryabhattai TaxID=412384 RepID=UPI000BFE285E|nr:hypothetical protein [Priestia aryabhattai]PHF65841.1 hypothetical protein COI42_23315 [Priestia aryabhattai]
MVKEYDLIAFKKWFKQKKYDINLIDKHPYNKTFFIKEYLKYSCKKWNLTFLLKCFQDYICLSYQEEVDTIEIIPSSLEESLTEVQESLFRNMDTFISTSIVNYRVYPDTLDKRPVLCPFFKAFLDFIKSNEPKKYKNLNNYLVKIAGACFEADASLEWWLKEVVEKYGIIIKELFVYYLSDPLNIEHILDFKNWLKKSRNKYVRFDLLNNEFNSTFQKREELLTEKLINKEVLKEEIVSKNIIITNKLRSLAYIDDYYIDFLHYLKHNNIDFSKPLPKLLIRQQINSYCLDNPYVTENSLHKLIKNINKSSRENDYLRALYRDIFGKEYIIAKDRKVKMHGMLLFEHAQNLLGFIKKHGEDIHHLTEDIIDFYFSISDLEKEKSCFEKMRKQLYLKDLSKESGIVVWENFGDEVEHLVMGNLCSNYNVVVSIIKFLTKQARTFEYEECIKMTKQEIEQIIVKQEKLNKIVISKSQVVIGENNVIHNPTMNFD